MDQTITVASIPSEESFSMPTVAVDPRLGAASLWLAY